MKSVSIRAVTGGDCAIMVCQGNSHDQDSLLHDVLYISLRLNSKFYLPQSISCLTPPHGHRSGTLRIQDLDV